MPATRMSVHCQRIASDSDAQLHVCTRCCVLVREPAITSVGWSSGSAHVEQRRATPSGTETCFTEWNRDVRAYCVCVCVRACVLCVCLRACACVMCVRALCVCVCVCERERVSLCCVYMRERKSLCVREREREFACVCVRVVCVCVCVCVCFVYKSGGFPSPTSHTTLSPET